MNNRNKYILALLLVMLLVAGNVMAQSGPGVRIHGSVFGGGNNADVKVNTAVKIGNNNNAKVSIDNNVYGGGNLGYVGTFTSTENPATGSKEYTWSNGGTCEVTMSSGTVGPANNTDTKKGNVFGAGKGVADTYECEPAMVYKTNVSITKGTINGNVYGGGEVGRVENNTKVTIGPETGNDVADVKGSVFGAGAGLATHGYSALVRGNSTVLVQGKAKVAGSVYGGGETASVGRFVVNPTTSLPTTPYSGGTCTVTVNGQAAVTGNVYGACKGVEPDFANNQGHWMNDNNNPHPFADEAEYLAFLPTLALTSNTIVTIGGSATVGGSVFGGGQRGITLGYVEVDVTGGTVTTDVYGGGALANTNTANWDGTALTKTYYEITGLTVGTSPVSGLYTRSGSSEPYTYTPTTDTNAQSGTKYYRLTDTQVSLTGGTVGGDVYGGGLGRKATSTVSAVEAIVYGDVKVELNNNNGTCQVNGSVFGCNNANGTPMGDVVVNVYGTSVHNTDGTTKAKPTKLDAVTAEKDYISPTDAAVDTHIFELAGVYGGGNLAAYNPVSTKSTTVNIYGCTTSSIKEVYGGGNSADVTNCAVNVYGAYEIGYVYNGGNGWLEGVDNATSDAPANVTGTATTTINGGTIYRTFGGSNTNGSIGTAVLNIADGTGEGACGLYLGDVFSYGNKATMTNPATVTLGCLANKVGALYGGAMNANIGSSETSQNIVLNINGGKYHQVFGGNKASGTIHGSIKVNIEQTQCDIVIDELYGCGNQAAYTTTNGTTNYADPEVNVISCKSIGSVYGGGWGSDAVVTGNPKVNINMLMATDVEHTALGTIGNVYGGGFGADVVGNTEVNIGTTSTVTLPSTSSDGTVLGANITGNVYGGGEGSGTTVTGDVVVNIGGEESGSFVGGDITIGGSVYGGSALGAVNATRDANDQTKLNATTNKTTAVTLKKGNVTRYVFGGGMGNGTTTAHVYGKSTVTLYGDVVAGGLYGGCDANGEMHGDTQLDILGGTVGAELAPTDAIPDMVFGGGLGAATTVDGNVTVNVGSSTYTGNTSVTIWGNVYGGGALGSVNTNTSNITLVNLYKGTVNGNVFGGGLGQAAKAAVGEPGSEGYQAEVPEVAAGVKGNVLVKLNDNNGTCVVTGSIFGCNNTKGSPEGHATVHVYKTVSREGQGATDYDLAAVYGGGNNADYEPTDDTKSTEVIIEGCGDTSIGNVYGGGNAAAVPATEVWILGSKIINNVYGGGNGELGADYAAHVGFHRTSTGKTPYATGSGSGETNVKLVAGNINNVYGGSNSNGDIRVKANVTMPKLSEYTANHGTPAESSCCTKLTTQNVYGGGNAASMEGDVNIILECMPDDYVDAVYGGAQNASINGNVSLTVTSGKFGRVFGGNNKGGSINGTITVNVKEEGCKDLEIGELYGGGNLAPYSKFGCYLDNTDNKWKAYEEKSTANGNFEVTIGSNELYPYHIRLLVESCTSIGKIFGGGLGETATVIGDTYVNVNMMYGSVNNVKKTKLGHIGQVFGGGSAANVIGDTKVDIGTATASEDVGVFITKTIGETGSDDYNQTKYLHPENDSYIALDGAVYGGGMNANVDGNTTINIGTVVQSLGTLIDGNVYGGGKEGDVTGTTQVNVCAVKNGDSYSSATLSAAGVTITGDVFGAGQGVGSDVTKALVGGDSKVVMGNGSVKKSVYGGGELSQVAGNTDVSVIGGTIGTPKDGTTVYGGATYGNVYGGGKGNTTNVAAGLIKGNTKIAVSNGTILHNIYGGGAYGSVGEFDYDATTGLPTGLKANTTGGKAEIIITGGTFGIDGKENGMIFGSSRGDVGAPDEIHDKLAWVYNTEVKVGTEGSGTVYTTPIIRGSVYGGGENGHNFNNADVYIYSGTIGIPTGTPIGEYSGAAYPYRGNVYGGGCGTDKYYSYTPIPEGHTATDGEGDKYNPLAGIVRGNATVNVSGGHVVHNVYGAGAMGSVGTDNSGGKTTINISGGRIGYNGNNNDGNVYGAARGEYGTSTAASGLANVRETEVNISYTSTPTADNEGKTAQLIAGSVFGGGESGTVKESVAVNMSGGLVLKDIYGGGALADTQTSNWNTAVTPNTWADTNKKSSLNTTTVRLTGGIINGEAYGGGLGEAGKPAYVWGDVLVDLNGTTTYDTYGKVQTNPIANKGCVVAQVFGCNNVNGTPKGEVLVHVHATQKSGGSSITDKTIGTYDVHAVYGGGNQAEYWPVAAKANGADETEANHIHTNVIIDGCTLSSIEMVYGGGNAASTPATCVTVNGAYEIGELFGGGNGASTSTFSNPGANVGFHHYEANATNAQAVADRATNYGYGFGKAQVYVGGGTIHAVFGGSNSKGNVREVAIAMLDKNDENCIFAVGKAYGGGKAAEMDGRAILQLGCVPSVDEVYGGAESAAIHNDVELTITNGTYKRIFGGNNKSGSIDGKITINIEETGCTPIVIGQVFAGGNEAPYTTPLGKDDPVINVKSFTSIGQIFGGGFGPTAKLTGNPTINIDEIVGDKATAYDGATIEYNKDTQDTSDDYTVAVPAHTADKIGTIGDVYGGGYGADVVGDVTVNIGTQETITFAGSAPTRTDLTITDGKYTVTGVNIARSVYGGGYGAATTVTGNVEVNIGGQKTEGTTTTFIGGDITIGGSVYGGSALGAVNATRDANDQTKLNATANKTTAVTLKKGNVTRYVFGGGMGNGTTTAHVYGKSTVTLYGDVVAGGLYGGCDANGEMHGDTQLDLLGGTVGAELAPTDAIPDMVFGGGLGAATTVDGNVTVNVGSSTYTGNTSVTIWGNVYGGGALGSVNTNTSNITLVNLYKGTVKGNVFGGGLGQAAKAAVGEPGSEGYQAAVLEVAAGVKGNATVKLNENNGTCEVTGSIFGCNNTKGSPEGHVLVHVFKTYKTGNTKDATNKTTIDDRWSENAVYDLNAVYGGGNKADYEPTSATDYAEVIIEGCDLTSIKEVYGGGFGAAVPATKVQIKGTYLINEVFGGGYGAGANNKGANVGYYTYASETDKADYGDGKTKVELYGGKVHTIYGGSNTKGNIREGTAVDKMTDPAVTCSLEVKNIYGAGKNADQDAGTMLAIGCIPGLKNVYGGAKDANIKGGVNLVITGGDFENVFGGNDTSGTIQGPIKLYIEESCAALNITNLYLGGNLAPYSVYGYKQGTSGLEPRINANDGDIAEGTVAPASTQYADPVLYVTKFTKIDNVFGGGYGSSAVMYGNPTVFINEVSNLADNIGEIGNVFGGGNEAKVVGNTTINIGTTDKVALKTDDNNEHDVLGANITGNVYGGGNLADVTGNTLVNICSEFDQINNKYVSVAEGTTKVTIGGDVYGGGKGSETDVTEALVNNAIVVMGNGSVKKSVYGGGELSQVAGNTDVSVIGGTIGTPKDGTTVYGGATYGNVYGGGKGNITNVAAGLIKGNTKIAVSNGTILHNIYGGGAYGSVGTFTYDEDATNAIPDGTITGYTSGGKAVIEITGGTIGTTGKENGMIFGSSRGDVGGPGEIHDRLAWVYDTEVKIGTSGSDSGPQIHGSVYGGGENGHNYRNADVYIYSGTVGIASGEKVTSGGKEYEGAAYPYRGNVYGGGCGTDKYYSYTPIPDGHTATDGEGDKYNPLAGIVQGNAKVTVTGGYVVHNIYGAGAMGSVGTAGDANTGKTTIDISGGRIGYDGNENGNIYGAARGDSVNTQLNLAQVRETDVYIKPNATAANNPVVWGSVYGGGESGDVTENTSVAMSGGNVKKNVFGGGKGVANSFTCAKAMVGIVDTGIDAQNNPLDGGTTVNITNGTVEGDVYGGGEIARVERNTIVTIGEAGNTSLTPVIHGNVFGAGKGLETHGYSALVRGNATVTIQGQAQVWQNVHGGGEKASVGRYNVRLSGDTQHTEVKVGMPYSLKAGGKCTVIIQDGAVIGTDNNENTGHVYGAGQGVTPVYNNTANAANRSKRMVTYTSDSYYPDGEKGITWDYYENYPTTYNGTKYVWEYFANENAYLQYVETLGRASETDVIIGGKRESTGIVASSVAPTVKGSVYGGSESGFVYYGTEVNIPNGTVKGDVFGGGKGLASFAEAGRVRRNTNLTISGNGAVEGNVYGGGSLGDVGTITKSPDYNYTWKQTDGTTVNTHYNNAITDTNNNTGICMVTISGGTIGVANAADKTKHGNVFGAGRGSSTTWWCEKAIVYATNVNISKGTVYGNVYGGGEVGRVEDDAKVTIGSATGTDNLTIAGSVFGAGAGLATHGYSALLRGNADVTVQGKAQIGGSVYGGGEIASVGRFKVVSGLPSKPQAGGTCTVKILGDAKIGSSGTGHNVFGACKGVTPAYEASGENRSKSMQLLANAPENAALWSHYNNDENSPFIWRYYASEQDYLDFLKTLALTSNTDVTIDGNSEVYGSVYGGGERGVTLGGVDVNMIQGTVHQDVYGGGSLADSNTAMWDAANSKLHDYVELNLLEGLSHVTGYYTKSGDTYSLITTAGATAASGTQYYAKYKTNVNLKGGTIDGDAYGGGLGQLGTNPIEAKVYGDVSVNLGTANDDTAPATAFTISTYDNTDVVKSGRIFGCNNLNGSPMGNVTVTINRTVEGNTLRTDADKKESQSMSDHRFEVAAVYGGGNLADYTPASGQVKVLINSCDVSINEVYGGGNAAEVPSTDVEVKGAYEIGQVFGGGNGADKYTLDGGATWIENPGANVNGNANTVLRGGLIHEAYGGSNEKGTITGNITIDTGTGGCEGCPVKVDKLVGAGKNADVNGNLIMVMGCKDGTKIPLVYGGADNANVNGNVELTITSGNFGQVFGGNNKGGAIKGHIILNIEETSECEPINIDELYLGGNQASYSIYGYYLAKDDKGEQLYRDAEKTKPLLLPRTSATDERKPVQVNDTEYTNISDFKAYDQPVLNVVSCTSIGTVYGGGYGVGGDMYADPTVNINMIPGNHHKTSVPAVMTAKGLDTKENPHELGVIGDVFGGGNAAAVIGNPTVNIGTETTVKLHESLQSDGITYNMSAPHDVDGAYITGDVFGGGNQADVTGNPTVNICAKKSGDSYVKVEEGDGGVTIRGSKPEGGFGRGVFGGGNNGIVNGDSYVNLGGGSVLQSVYGGGCNADVMGNTHLTMLGGYVYDGVCGGGLKGSVGTFTRDKAVTDFGHTANHDGCIGKPTACEKGTGTCYVVISGGQVGPVELATKGMTGEDGPVAEGWVWGAGRGLIEDPKNHPDTHFLTYVNNTDLTIKDDAFIVGSIIGGGEFGRVLGNTLVKIEGGQIGVGKGQTTEDGLKPKAYTAEQWVEAEAAVRAGDASRINTIAAHMPACSHWNYGKEVDGKKVYDTYDPYAYKYPDLYPGGSTYQASDGKTWTGCVFGGGSGYFPYIKDDGSGYDWARSAGWVEGNTEVRISGGHIMTNVYGGNEYTDVKGTSKVTMTGGTIGVPRKWLDIEKLPMAGFLFGAGKGDPRSHFITYTNVQDVKVEISGGVIFGSVYGGSEDGHVLGDVEVTIKKNTDSSKPDPVIGTWGTSYFDGNVFGGGRGFSGEIQTAGTVGGNVTLNIEGGNILGNVFGGGRLASVGTQFTTPDDDNYGNFLEDEGGQTYGHVTVDISGGTIGSDRSKTQSSGSEVERAQYSGNVFGGSMGRLNLLNGSVNPIWPKMAQVKATTVNVYGDAEIKRNVYGGGEFGTVRDDTHVTISGGIVKRDVFGGGYGSENDDVHTIFTVKELEDDNNYHDHTYAFTPMQFAGCVGKSTTVDVKGGYIRKSVYGGGEMASVGVINYRAQEVTAGTSTDDKIVIHDETSNKDYYYTSMVKHGDETKQFALSWPFKFEYVPGYEGATHVNITGGRLGLREGDSEDTFKDNGDVYGGGMGFAGDYEDYVFCANVGSAHVTINYPNTLDPANYESDGDCVAGAVYAGAENGHVMGDAKLTLISGLVGHSAYGGGSGKGTYKKRLLKIGADPKSTNPTDSISRNIYSITAGKVFGNCEVDMSGGLVVRNVYGGGNMGSVGKGNYAGGDDDYYSAGYGEKAGGNLWDGKSTNSQAFLNSGKCTVNITGGTVGYINPNDPTKSKKDGLPYGNVFGGCRGESAPNIVESPRYLYSPEFFVGYANETEVTIGTKGSEAGPRIYGSVYGGGQDGHVRRDATVTINSGRIGSEYSAKNIALVKTNDLDDILWLHRGNVYGAGSGIGKYQFDFNGDGEISGSFDYNNGRAVVATKEEDFSTSAGSVTRFTTVNVNGGTIYRNVYGGGSLSSVGAPKIPPTRTDELLIRDDSDKATQGKQSLNQVNIFGGNIGNATGYTAGYGGHIYGGSRGGEDGLSNPSSYATAVWTDVNVRGGVIAGDVYGGGEAGTVRQSTDVALTGGTVTHDVYGGGKGTANIAADVAGNATVTLNQSITDKGCVVDRIFGANNVNGTPKGHAKVHVYATQNANKEKVNEKVDGQYDVAYVFGGGNQADYVPTDATQSTEVIIEGCDLSSIKEVYGGGYGAAVPGTNVLVKGTKIIDNVFGGGYGAGENNYGANVGYRTYVKTEGKPYGHSTTDPNFKTAVVRLMAGKINNVYGGSNTKGDIRGGASVTNVTNTHETGCCDNLHVGQIYGGGKDAEMQGGTEIVLGCMPNDWIEEIYAGAQNADVGNDVSLTLTSGRFGRVFGGNKKGGRLNGGIEVNIEENPECDVPIIIGELYGGGNLAPYSIYGYYEAKDDKGNVIKDSDGNIVYKPRTLDMYNAMSEDDKASEGILSGPHQSPRVNVRAFTSIGNIYGGGYGAAAEMIGSPTVNVNEVMLDEAQMSATGKALRNYEGEDKVLTDDNGQTVTVKLYPHTVGTIGVIGNVFGGGNAAKVVGNTNVNIGNKVSVVFESLKSDMNAKVKQVVGADIRGNVYGGGNNADVTGKTNVLIGNEVQQAQ